MSKAIQFLKSAIPWAKLLAKGTPTPYDDELIDLIEFVLNAVPNDPAAAKAKIAELKKKLGA